MELWGYSFQVQASCNEDLLAFHALYFKSKKKYELYLLDSSIKYNGTKNKEYTFFVDVPSKEIDLIFIFHIKDSNIIIEPIYKMEDTIYLATTENYNLKVNENRNKKNIYMEFLYPQETNTNFKILDITNKNIIFPYLFYNKYHQIESKINIIINKEYLEVRVKTHTKLNTIVSNVQDNMYYLSTWMTNCTKLYNINYNFFIENKKLIIEIENKTEKKELIDMQAQAISNYTEIFNTDIVSKVEVITNTQIYYLYLLEDRTTTTDKNSPNRAEGRTERTFTENFEDAPQKALDVIKTNSYNHNITFNMFNKIIKIGTPTAIKTKKSIILNTYISAIKITPKNFIEYICGNVRIKFIDKLLKERND